MDFEDVNKKENRLNAKIPSIVDNGINQKFGSDFDRFVQDRIGLRDKLIKLNSKLRNKINGIAKNALAVRTENGTMFYIPWIGRVFGNVQQGDLNKVVINLRKLEEWTKERNVKLYILLCPVKEYLYVQSYPEPVDTRNTKIYDLINVIKKETNIRVVFPEEIQKANIDKKLFFQTDTHQTDEGGYLNYIEFMKELNRDFDSRVPIVDISEYSFIEKSKVKVGLNENFGNGYIFDALNLNAFEYNDNYKYKYFIPSEYVTSEKNEKLERVSLNPKGKLKAVVLGDSFTENQYIWFQESFTKTMNIRCNNGLNNNDMIFSRWESRIDSEKPDVLILCLSQSDSLIHLSKLF